MSRRPDFFNKEPLPYDCPFRDKCLKLLDRRATFSDAKWWVVEGGGFAIIYTMSGSVVVYHDHDLIWKDGEDPWVVEDHEAEEYEDMLDRLMVLDALADV